MVRWAADIALSGGAKRAALRVATIGLVAAVAAVLVGLAIGGRPRSSGALPDTPGSYLGLFVRGVPGSYAPVAKFVASTGVTPGIDLYYSGWREDFQVKFAAQANEHGAVPFVEIDPTNVSLRAIAAGRYDDYLRGYADAVRAYRLPVIVGFGHEMNGWWSPWGYRHQSPSAFVAAWRHVVTLFRRQRADNVTWLWVVNVIDKKGGIPDPSPWWPGRSYVTWIGIDGYYNKPSWTFASLFGPTIKAVRALDRVPLPILIAETGAVAGPSQASRLANLFDGVRAYGLLGLVLFDARTWQLSGRQSIATFRAAASAYQRG